MYLKMSVIYRLVIIVIKLFITFTFMLPCIVIYLFLNNQPDALIIQIYSVIKLYMFWASSFQAESGWNCSSILTLLGNGNQKPA